jgi:hypothetical protein
MKKSKKIGLSLNKKTVSKFKSGQLSGGSSQARSRYGDCQNGGGGTWSVDNASICVCV